MKMRDGLSGAADRLRLAQAERRAGSLERRGQRLDERLRTVKAELDHEREARRELAGLLQDKEGEMRKGHPVLRMLIVGGVAYVLGAKAGRSRYEEIMAKGRELRDRFRGEIAETTTTDSPSTTKAIASSGA
ncbi:MAG TPA: hypothetical protein VF235_04520 [Actinomycetota bacterium]